MKLVQSISHPDLCAALKAGQVAVLRTDTLYGLVARVDDKLAVQKVYDIKHRNQAKSPIVLISDRTQLYDKPSQLLSAALDNVWPGKVSVIIPSDKAPDWISRENRSVAYRLPDSADLQQLISQTGPLVAPSANPEGENPAMTINQAIKYFGDKVDIYVDGGTVTDTAPSQLLQVSQTGEIERLR